MGDGGRTERGLAARSGGVSEVAGGASERDRGRWERALVTGASEGIGEEFARQLAARGCELVLVARRQKRLEELAAELGSGIEVLPADLTDPDQVSRVEARLEQSERAIDLLVNNAGSQLEHRPFLERARESVTAEAYMGAIAVLRLTHAAAGAMAARGGGHVINMSSGIAFYPVPGSPTYGASKAFVSSLSEALDYDLRDAGVRVTAVCPGFTRTRVQDRLGFNLDVVPRAFWTTRKQVVEAALRAAERGRPLSNVSRLGAVNAFLGRHLPHRLWLPRVARFQERLGRS
jgi:short-subunit dehydrogenase